MIISYNEILDRVKHIEKYSDVYKEAKPLIENFELESLQGASYDIRLSNRIMRQNNASDIIHLNKTSDINSMFEEDDISYGYLLRPNEYIMCSIIEKINMPDDLTAHIRPRTTLNKLGLIVTSQHINPSFCGSLYIGIKNMTNSIIEIHPGISIAQIVFEEIKGKIPSEHLYRNKKNSKYQNEDTFIASKIYDEYTVKKAQELIDSLLK